VSANVDINNFHVNNGDILPVVEPAEAVNDSSLKLNILRNSEDRNSSDVERNAAGKSADIESAVERQPLSDRWANICPAMK